MRKEEMTETTGVCNQGLICILGMHRSGTSLLTRVLNLIGVDLGSDEVLTTEPVADNPKGYWEHNEITSISDAILKRYGGSWDEPPLLPPGWETSAAIDDLRHHAQQLIQDQFAEVQLWGWKDPRSCLTLPFWQQLLPDMRYIIWQFQGADHRQCGKCLLLCHKADDVARPIQLWPTRHPGHYPRPALYSEFFASGAALCLL
jgi:hypothetical protein